MQRVLIVCGAGASSTFLARRIADLARQAGWTWRVEPAPIDEVRPEPADVVAVTSHVATEAAIAAFVARGIRYLILPDTVRGGFGADTALRAISNFLRKDGGRTDSTRESTDVEDTH